MTAAPLLRQMQVLLTASVPLERALKALQNGDWAPCVTTWLMEIRKGRSLSAAIASQPGALRPYHVKMVRFGERLGRLDECLGYLADQEEQGQALEKKARSALVYPMFVLGLVSLLVFVVPATFLRNILMMLKEHHQLPWYSQLLLTWSDLTHSPGFMRVCLSWPGPPIAGGPGSGGASPGPIARAGWTRCRLWAACFARSRA